MADLGKGAARAVIGQGLMMGWGDEGEAFLRSRLYGTPYEQEVAKIRAEYGEFSKEHPFIQGAGEFAGAALPMMLPGVNVAGAGVKGLAKLGAMCAAQGAISGAGAAEEGQRASGATSGAVLGGALGAGVPLAMRGVKGAATAVRDRFAPSAASIERSAAGKLSEVLAKDQVPATSLPDLMRKYTDAGTPATLANLTPRATRLAETAARRSGEAAETVEKKILSQQAGGRERVYSQVRKNLSPTTDFYTGEQDLVQKLRENAKTLYDKAYEHGAVYDPRIQSVLENPTFAKFYEKARAIADTEAQAAKLRGEDPSKYALKDLYKFDLKTNQPVLIAENVPDVRTLDYIKRGMDAVIDEGYRGKGMSSAEASGLKELRNQFVKIIDEKVDDYAAARKMYAGDAETLNALRTGMNDFNKLDHEQIANMVKGMTPGELDAFRTGVSRNIYSTIMDPSSNVNAASRIIGSPETQQKLAPLFDNAGQFNLFKAALEREAQLHGEAKRLVSASISGMGDEARTALEAAPGAMELLGGAVTGGPAASLASMASRFITDRKNMPEATANRLAGMLMSSDPKEVATVVSILEKYSQQAATSAKRAAAAEAGAAGGTIGAIYPAPSDKPKEAQKEEPAGPLEIEKDLAPTPTKFEIEEDLQAR